MFFTSLTAVVKPVRARIVGAWTRLGPNDPPKIHAEAHRQLASLKKPAQPMDQDAAREADEAAALRAIDRERLGANPAARAQAMARRLVARGAVSTPAVAAAFARVRPLRGNQNFTARSC